MANSTTRKRRLSVGDMAPDFTLRDQNDQPVRLWDLVGTKILVLFFYPKDHTAGCTRQVCAFRDSYEIFTENGADVLGISSDTSNTHKLFAAQQHLPFRLLSDTTGEVRKLYGVPATLGILPGRVTYVIDRTGKLCYIFASQFAVKKHIQEALRIVRTS